MTGTEAGPISAGWRNRGHQRAGPTSKRRQQDRANAKTFVLPLEKTPGWFGNSEHTVAAVSSLPPPLEERQSVNSSFKIRRFQKMSPGAAKHLSLVNPPGLIWSAARVTAERDPATAITARRQRRRRRRRHRKNRRYMLAADYRGYSAAPTRDRLRIRTAPAETGSVGRSSTKGAPAVGNRLESESRRSDPPPDVRARRIKGFDKRRDAPVCQDPTRITGK